MHIIKVDIFGTRFTKLYPLKPLATIFIKKGQAFEAFKNLKVLEMIFAF